MAINIIWAMEKAGVDKLIWISPIGVYDEIDMFDTQKFSPWLCKFFKLNLDKHQV